MRWQAAAAALTVLLPVLVLEAGCGAPRVRATNAYGADLAARGLWEEAGFYWRQAHAFAPADPEVLNNMAVSAEQRADFEQARRLYALALEHGGGAAVRHNLEALARLTERLAKPPPVEEEKKR